VFSVVPLVNFLFSREEEKRGREKAEDEVERLKKNE